MEEIELDYKDKRKQEIINAAKDLFLSKGLMKTTMDNIADVVGVSRRTLYRYYKTKEEIAFEIEIMLFQQLFDEQKEIYKNVSGNGYEKLEMYLAKLGKYIEQNPTVIQFSGEFDFYFTGEYPYSELTDKFSSMISSTDYILEEILTEGINDGSVREELDPKVVGLTISNSILSLLQRVLMRDTHLELEQGLDPKEMIVTQFEMLMYAIKNRK